MKEKKDQEGLDVKRLINESKESQKKKLSDRREMTFEEYLELVKKDPLIAQNSASRILEMVLDHGMKDISESENFLGAEKSYNLFSQSLFGIDQAVEKVVDHFRVGAGNLSTGKQILLLVGPPGSGKSTFATILKRTLERYANRPVYAIKGCPIHEEPLHLLPRSESVREKISQELGIKIEGDLCPVCRDNLQSNFKNDDKTYRWWDVPVETFTFSVQGTRGIGSFEPSDEKTADVSQLVGKENIHITSTKGHDHPQAYSLSSGELGKANRGIFEGRELIKAAEEMLWVFISVAEEKEMKVQGSKFPHIHIDTVIIGHTNLTEYKKFSGRQENEALHDRIYTVFFPYPLRVKDEVKIYKKLIHTENSFAKLKKCHIAPGSLELAALFAILTRLTSSNIGGLDGILTKAKVYNGEAILAQIRSKDKAPIDIRTLLENGQRDDDISKREGMFGVSSRDILAALNNALVKSSGENNGCLTPLKVTQALKEVFSHRMGYEPEEIQRYQELLSAGEKGSVLAEYKELVISAVQKAFLSAYQEQATELFNKYLEAAELWRDQKRKYIKGTIKIKIDDLTGMPKEPDIQLMRSVEENLGIAENEADNFRGEILEIQSRIRDFSYKTYRPLAEAVEKKLLDDSREMLSLVLNPTSPKAQGEEVKQRINDLFGTLVNDGFCKTCAKEAVERAREVLKR